MRIVTFNVNGLRAILKKGFMETFNDLDPDILCLQEIKARKEQVPEKIKNLEEYNSYWNSADSKKGYSGVITFSKPEPDKVQYGMGIERFDKEGRMIITRYRDFSLLNVYFPNGKSSKERLEFKLDYYDAFLEMTEKMRKDGEELIITGDVNTAHREIDLARPEDNKDVSGFLPVEREWIDKLLEKGYIDTFRYLHPDEQDRYSYWSYRTRARKRNVGWRLDYFFVTEGILDRVNESEILDDIHGSDHAPILLDIDVK